MSRGMLVLVALLCVLGLAGAKSPLPKEVKKEAEKESKSFDVLLKDVDKIEKQILKKSHVVVTKALADIETRRGQVEEHRKLCLTLEDRKERKLCNGQVKSEQRRLRKEAALITALSKCDEENKDDDKKRKACVEKVSVKLLKLTPKAEAKMLAKKIAKDAKKAETLVKRGADGAKKAVKRAIDDLLTRSEALKGHVDRCSLLKVASELEACRADVKQKVRDVRKAIKELKSLRRCAAVFGTDDAKRARCVKLIGDKLNAELKKQTHHVSKHFPKSMADLRMVERRTRRKLTSLIRKLARKFKKCESRKCRRELKQKLRKANRLLDQMHKNFKARRVCLLKRRSLRHAEFAHRSREHARLARHHRAVEKCSTNECIELESKKLRRIAAKMSASRARRQRKFDAVKCPGVGRLNLKSAETRDIRKKARRNGRFSHRAKLHLKLNRAYNSLADCQTKECSSKYRRRIAKYEERLNVLSRAEGMDRSKRRHSRRALLHERLTVLYRRASKCQSRMCRKVTRRQLRKIQAALAKIRRDFLAVRKIKSEKREVASQDAEDRHPRVTRTRTPKWRADGDLASRAVQESHEWFKHDDIKKRAKSWRAVWEAKWEAKQSRIKEERAKREARARAMRRADRAIARAKAAAKRATTKAAKRAPTKAKETTTKPKRVYPTSFHHISAWGDMLKTYELAAANGASSVAAKPAVAAKPPIAPVAKPPVAPVAKEEHEHIRDILSNPSILAESAEVVNSNAEVPKPKAADMTVKSAGGADKVSDDDLAGFGL